MNEFVDQEVRIRLLEKIAVDIDQRFDKIDHRFEMMEAEMRIGYRSLLDKMDTQFHWTLGIIFTLFGGIILHLAKLI